MSDIFGISATAVSSYQRALSTVSNNIANVGTEGYVRQESNLVENPAALEGKVYLGTGTRFAGVQRAYDQFLESNLRNSNSDLATQGPIVDYTNRVIDILGSDTVGLPPSMDKFFASARALSTDPSSTILRGQFLRDTEGLADRFHQLSTQMEAIELETRESINAKLNEINQLSGQLAVVNKQLAGKPTTALQPPELLDQRDRLLNDLSKLVKINVTTTTNGSVNISIGNTTNSGVILDGQKAMQIGAKFDVADMGRFTIVADPFGNQDTIVGVGNGELGGLISFREQVLQPAVVSLDFLARTLADEVNGIQSAGIDAHGEIGQKMFEISTITRRDFISGEDRQVDHAAAGIKVVMKDFSRIAAGSLFRVIENSDNLSGVDASLSYAPSYASTQRVKPLSQVILNNPNPSAGITAPGNVLLGQIPQGSDNWSLYLDNASGQQQIQVFTRDGRQLLGAALPSDPSDPEYGLLPSMMRTENGFVAGSTYSTAYLNQTGLSGYKQMEVFYGLKAEPSVKFSSDARFTDTHSVLPSANLKEIAIGQEIHSATSIAAGAFTINGKALPALTPTPPAKTIQASDLAAWLNRTTADMNPVVTVSAATQYAAIKVSDIDFSKKYYVNETGVSASDIQGLISAINSEALGITASVDDLDQLILSDPSGKDIRFTASELPIPKDKITLKNNLTINGIKIWSGTTDLGKYPNSDPLKANDFAGTDHVIDEADLLAAINAKTALTGVTAVDDGAGNWILTTSNAEIVITPSGTSNAANALNYTPTIQKGKLTITSLGEVTIGYGPNGKLEDLNPDTSPLGEPIGTYFVSVLPVVPMEAKISGSRIGSDMSILAGGALTLNGMVLKDDLIPPTRITIPANAIDLSSPFVLNGVTFNASGSTSAQELIDQINDSTSPFVSDEYAYLDKTGNIVIKNDKGADITLEAVDGSNIFGLSATSFHAAQDLKAIDIADWLNQQAGSKLKTPVNATASNTLKALATTLNPAVSLKINGTEVWDGTNVNGKAEDIVKAINSHSVGVTAYIDTSGNILITNDTGEDIVIGSGSSRNALGIGNGEYKGSIDLASTGEIKLGFTGGVPPNLTKGGTPADLAKLGMRTGVYIDGAVSEDLLVFVTGEGNGTIAGSFDASMKDPATLDAERITSLRAQKFDVTFTSPSHYQVSWKNPANGVVTILAERDYDKTEGINYQGLLLKLSSDPMAGDKFVIDGNQDGLGNNENILNVVALQNKVVVGGPNGFTLSQAYEDQVSKVGNVASQAKVAQAALEVVNQQAIENKDKVSGVSLDSEAADLIRYQQAYQAAAKAMQTASQMFDSILQLR